MGALVESFLEADKTQAAAGKYAEFTVGYHGDEAAIVFQLRCPQTFSLAEGAPYSHSGEGRRGYKLRITSQDSEIFPIDLLEAEIARTEKGSPESPDLEILRQGKAKLDAFISQNGQFNPKSSYSPRERELACA